MSWSSTNIPVGDVNNGNLITVDTSGPTPTYQQPDEYVDPYARYGGTSAYNNLVSGFNTQKQGVFDSANAASAQSGRTLQSGILDRVGQYKQGQNAIDERAITADQAKMQGTQGVLGMVGRGIKSGGVMLANKNAGDSSAAGALAQAYGDVGRRQMADIGNQYAGEQRQVAGMQSQLGDEQATWNRHYDEQKQQMADSIANDARTQLSALNEAMIGASLPDRIAIQQEADRIKSEALGALSQYDQMRSEQFGGIQAKSADARRAEAAQRTTAGKDLGANAFQYSEQAPMANAEGPYSSELPIFTYNSRRNRV